MKYLCKSKGPGKVHSPFVFEFVTEVLQKSSSYNDAAVARLRNRLLSDENTIQISDFGAGSRKTRSNERKIKNIARNSGISPKYGKLLAQIVEHYGVKNSVELGTSLGIGSSYLASASPENNVQTLEGCPNLAKQANENLQALKLTNVSVINGKFDELLETEVAKNRPYDLVFIDGNHTREATLQYFRYFLNHTRDLSFMIFDDIHWSLEMESAWEEIISSSEIHVSIDLFRMGIVMKKPDQVKEHFVLRF